MPLLSVTRLEDMSPKGALVLTMEPDGDVIVTVMPDPDENSIDENTVPIACIQFCTHGGGGGSPRTHTALRNLFAAMVADNADEANGHRRGPQTPGMTLSQVATLPDPE